MSMTSNSPGYARHMDEVFAERDERDHSHEEYLEWCYLQSLKNETNNPKNQNDDVDSKQ